MKHFFFTLNCFLLAIISSAQFPKLTWAKSMGGPLADFSYSVVVDASGNVYTTGPFYGTADFDPGAGIFNLTSNGQNDAFISKLDASGNFVWAKSFGGTAVDGGRYIAVDAAGNVYTTGQFGLTVDFDPGPGTYNLTSAGVNDIYVSKLDASGNFVWAKQMGGAFEDIPLALTLDPFGNIYTTGMYTGTADFNPGSGISNLNSNGNYDIFISKLNSSGNFVWARSIGGTDIDQGRSIKTDASGNVYTTGDFIGTADFDPGAGVYNLTSSVNGMNDMFISKLDSSGNFVWAKQMRGSWIVNGRSLSVDASGNVYTAGQFQDTVDFDPGTGKANLYSKGDYDMFLSKLDASGNFKWVKQIGGVNTESAFSIATDASGNIYTTGWFQNTVDFDPNVGEFYLTSNAGSKDIFISKFDPSGNLVWAKNIGTTGGASTITTDVTGNFYLTGYYNATLDCDPNSGVFNITSAGSSDIFIIKFSQTSLGISENPNFNSVTVFPNPTSKMINIDLGPLSEGSFQFQILNSLGQVIRDETSNSIHAVINLQNLADGIYFIKLIRDDQVLHVQKIIKQ